MELPLKNCVYKLTSPSGKVYIGQAKCFKRRMAAYARCDARRQPKLLRAIRKYGFSAFTQEVIDGYHGTDIKDGLDTLETYWISHFNSTVVGYNCCAVGTSQRGITRSLEVRQRAAAIGREVMSRPGAKDRASVASLARWASPAYRQMLAKAKEETPISADVRERMAIRMSARMENPEYRAAVAAGLSSYWRDPATRDEHSRRVANQWEDPARIAELSERMKLRWQDGAYIAANKIGHTAAMNDPAHRKRMAEITSDLWKDPAYTSKQRTAHLTATTSPEARKAASVRSKRMWADPVQREIRLAATAKSTAAARTEEARKAAAVRNKLAWADPVQRASRMAAIAKSAQVRADKKKSAAFGQKDTTTPQEIQ